MGQWVPACSCLTVTRACTRSSVTSIAVAALLQTIHQVTCVYNICNQQDFTPLPGSFMACRLLMGQWVPACSCLTVTRAFTRSSVTSIAVAALLQTIHQVTCVYNICNQLDFTPLPGSFMAYRCRPSIRPKMNLWIVPNSRFLTTPTPNSRVLMSADNQVFN